MFGNSVKKGVMVLIEKRIARAQELHEIEVQELEAQLEKDKAKSLEFHINSVLTGDIA